MPAPLQRVGLPLLALLSLAIGAYAIVAYTFWPMGAAVHPLMRVAFSEQAPAVYAHVFGSAVALLLGPLQFWTALRTARPRLHRWLGVTYLTAGVCVGGLAGLALSARAYGGLPSTLGFACLALAWLYTASHAYGAALNRNFAEHQRWMIRNFALTFAAVTLRLWLPASVALRLPFELAYPVIAWLCWMPNLLVAEWLIRRRRVAASAPALSG